MPESFSANVFGTTHEFELEKIFNKQKQYDCLKLRLLLSEAVYQRHQLENEYQVARALFARGQLQKDSKIPEWKIKNRFLLTDESKQYREGIAKADRTINRLKSVIETLSVI